MVTHMLKLFCLLLCGVILAPVPAGSFPYQPGETILIMSESTADVDETYETEAHTWRVVPEITATS